VTIQLGPLEGFAVHLAAGDRSPEQGLPDLLCLQAGERLAARTIHTWSTTSDKVTCQSCVEWMHA